MIDEALKMMAQHGPWALLCLVLIYHNQRNYEAAIKVLSEVAKAMADLSSAVEGQPERLRAALLEWQHKK